MLGGEGDTRKSHLDKLNAPSKQSEIFAGSYLGPFEQTLGGREMTRATIKLPSWGNSLSAVKAPTLFVQGLPRALLLFRLPSTAPASVYLCNSGKAPVREEDTPVSTLQAGLNK